MWSCRPAPPSTQLLTWKGHVRTRTEVEPAVHSRYPHRRPVVVDAMPAKWTSAAAGGALSTT